jgi:hypothetical protein
MASNGAGTKPVFAPDGSILGPECRNLMIDPGQQLTLREALAQGVGKAHRSVTYAHFEFRNYRRSYLGETGRLPR